MEDPNGERAPPCCWHRCTCRSGAGATAPNLKAEVRGIQQDGLHLQARSQKYGKLQRGQLLTVPPYLVRRRKQHFHHLELCRVDLILGCNGFICVGEHVEAKDDMVEDQASKLEQQNIKYNKNSISLEEQEQTYTLIETRQSTCRIANAVRVLSILGFNIAIEVIMDTMNLSSSLNLDIHEMLDSELCVMC
nr:exosome complex component rrp4 like [Quercus suber]